MDHGHILALDTPAGLKASVGADTVVSVRTTGDPGALAQVLGSEISGVARTRVVDGTVELHVQGTERMVPSIVTVAERHGLDIIDLSISEPTLETVFINLTGKELRE